MSGVCEDWDEADRVSDFSPDEDNPDSDFETPSELLSLDEDEEGDEGADDTQDPSPLDSQVEYQNTSTTETSQLQAARSGTLEQKSPLPRLPTELILNIVMFLPYAREIFGLACTCKRLFFELKEEAFKRALDSDQTYVKLQNNTQQWPSYLETILVRAIKKGNTGLLGFIEAHLDKQPRGPNNMPLFQFNRPFTHTTNLTMLGLAAKQGDIQLAEWLLLRGAKPNARNTNPLQLTIQRALERESPKCPKNMARLLLTHGANAIEPSKTLVTMRQCECEDHEPGVDCLLALATSFLCSPDFVRYPEEAPRIVEWMELLKSMRREP